eukprot:s2955_g10.t1
MLGVQIDTTQAPSGIVTVGHTVDRKRELAAAFDQAIQQAKLETKVAESLRGRMVFYECFAAGRTTNLLLKDFGKLCREGRVVEELTTLECENLQAIRDRVLNATPVKVSPKFMDTWFVFTDGACETDDHGDKVGGVGGVLVSANGTYLQHFGMQIPREYMLLFLQHSKHPVHEAESAGFSFFGDLHGQLQHVPNAAARQLLTAQPRGQRLRPLVSEYGTYVAAVDDETSVAAFIAELPKGAKVCHRKLFPGGVVRDDIFRQYTDLRFSSTWVEQTPCELLHIGVPREPADFLREAIDKGHPRDIIAQVPELVKPALESLLKGDMAERFQMRANFMKKWLRRSLELREAEKQLHDGMPAHLKNILDGKRLLLWKEILQDLNYPDVAVVDDIISGFALTGWAPTTGIFRPDVRKPSLSVQQLVNMSPGLNASVLDSLARADPGEHDQFVWDETMNEVSKGWLGMSDASGECFIARRFPVPQKSKVRLVDDFSVAGVNAAFGQHEKLRVQAVDELCAYLASMLDSSGDASFPRLVGRTYDLRSAYKQFGTDPWHSDRLRIAVKRPSGGCGVFRALALPFGASGSVVHFLRISASLTFIGVAALMLVWTSFFDDFTCICCLEEEKNTSFYIESLFRMLGVDFADSGDKAVPFTPRFKTLGVLFDVSGLREGSFSLEHTEGRRTELTDSIQDLIKRGCSSPKELERLHGRLIWFGSFVYGRLLNRLVKEVSNKARVRGKSLQFDAEFLDVLQRLMVAIKDSKPVSISKSLCHTWIIFTDGAYEPGSQQPATYGGVLVSPSGTPVEMFGEQVPSTLLDEFLAYSKHPIYEMEVLPVVIACKLWTRYITGSPTVFYLDNVAARASCIRGDGATKATRIMILEFVKFESRFRILSWFGRVPSHSNVSDGPSRLCFTDPLLRACRRVNVVAPSHLQQWGWKVRYGNPVVPPALIADDTPSDAPVSIADEPVEEATALQTGQEEYEQGEGLDEFNFADEFFDRLASEQATGSFLDRDVGLGSFSTDEPKGFDFVDKGEDLNAGKGMSFSHVGRAAPATVVIREALRLTDKKVVLFPWEKGRMAKIFGDQGRLEVKRPKLHASGNSFVRINVEVSDGLKCRTALDVQPQSEDRAIYSSVVRHVLGGSYIEERESRRAQAVLQWWDLLRLDFCHFNFVSF